MSGPMGPLAFAWRSLSREPARAVLAVAGVAVVGALLLDMLLLSRGLLLSFGETLEATGWDVRVTATRALPGLGPTLPEVESLLEEIRSLPEVEDAIPVRWTTVRTVEGVLPVTILATHPRGRGEWLLVRGRSLRETPPGELPETLVNTDLARELDLEPGNDVALRGQRAGLAPLPARFRVAGIADMPFEEAGELGAVVTISAFRAAHFGVDRDVADMLLVASRAAGEGGAASVSAAEAAAAAVRAARPDLHVFTIGDVIERVGGGEFSYFGHVSRVLATITAFFAFLLVTTLLTVSVSQRLGEVAALRALGFRRLRVAADLVAEAVVIVAAGGALSVPLGLLLALVLERILEQLPDVPERLSFFVLEPRALVVHALVLGATALAAAAWPVVLATRLPIADTLRREMVS